MPQRVRMFLEGLVRQPEDAISMVAIPVSRLVLNQGEPAAWFSSKVTRWDPNRRPLDCQSTDDRTGPSRPVPASSGKRCPIGVSVLGGNDPYRAVPSSFTLDRRQIGGRGTMIEFPITEFTQGSDQSAMIAISSF